MKYLNSFNSYYRSKYGQRVDKIALSLGLECPNRSKGGCIYCSPVGFIPYYLNPEESIRTQLKNGKGFLKSKKSKLYFAYFQQETTTASSKDILINSIEIPLSDPDCVGIIISTRPDYIEIEFLEIMQKFKEEKPEKEFLIELGLQSSNDATLKFINRNHSYSDYDKAMEMIKNYPFIVKGVHVIFGIPGEDFLTYHKTLKDVIESGINYIKIHHLQVVKNTPLEKLYNNKSFELFEFNEYITTLCKIIPNIPEDIILHRLWSNCPKEILVGPKWRKRSYEIQEELEKMLKTKKLWQGKNIRIEKK